MKTITKRLTKGADLKIEIAKFALEENISSGLLLSTVGSLNTFNVRLPVINGEIKTLKKNGDFEILSGNGTISKKGESMHIHLAVADENGNCFGGHLLDGCIVKTTIELVILVNEEVTYAREIDKQTGFQELVIH